jgi:putative Holliday junction resolvase
VVETIAARLRTLVTIPVVLQDERLSSHEADSLLAQHEKDWRKRKVALDATSAAIILQDYLDSHSEGRG